MFSLDFKGFNEKEFGYKTRTATLRWQRKLSSNMDDFFVNRVLPALQLQIADNFASEGSRWSGGWKALDRDYASYKGRKYGNNRIGHKTGQMERALTEGTHGTFFSMHSDITGNAVTMSYGVDQQAMPHAYWFNLQRRLFPLNRNSDPFFAIELPKRFHQWASELWDKETI